MYENDKREDEQVFPNEMLDVTKNQLDHAPADSAANTDNEPYFPPVLPESDTVETTGSADPSVADIGEASEPLRTELAANASSDAPEIVSSVADPEDASEADREGSLEQERSFAPESSFGEEQNELGNVPIESPAPGPLTSRQNGPAHPEGSSYFGGMIKYVTADRTSDLNPRTKRMLRPTADGGKPLARPVVEIRLSDEQLQRLHSQERLEAARKNEQTCRELTQAEIRKEFWRRDCQERAIIGH